VFRCVRVIRSRCSVRAGRVPAVLLEPAVLPGAVQRRRHGRHGHLRHAGSHRRLLRQLRARVQGACSCVPVRPGRPTWRIRPNVFKAVAEMYRWTHVVVVSDDETESIERAIESRCGRAYVPLDALNFELLARTASQTRPSRTAGTAPNRSTGCSAATRTTRSRGSGSVQVRPTGNWTKFCNRYDRTREVHAYFTLQGRSQEFHLGSGGFKAKGLVGHRWRGPPEGLSQTSA